jgi:hypothetical protein
VVVDRVIAIGRPMTGLTTASSVIGFTPLAQPYDVVTG